MTKMYISEPEVIIRPEQPYVAIPIQVTLKEWEKTVELITEIFGWLQQNRLEAAGPPFYRYWCIGNEEEDFHVEVGVPISRMVAGDDRVIGSFIPGGSYATAIHTGHPDQLPYSLEALEDWALEEELELDKRWEGKDEIWNGRFEFYITDPASQPDLYKWRIEIAYLLVRDEAA